MDEQKPCCPGPRYFTAFGRRSFIQAGLLGLSLPDLLRFTAKASDGSPRIAGGGVARPEGKAKSIIQIILPGGLAAQESWDPIQHVI